MDDWVLCRIYKKNTSRPMDHDHGHERDHQREDSMDGMTMMGSMSSMSIRSSMNDITQQYLSNNSSLDNSHVDDQQVILFDNSIVGSDYVMNPDPPPPNPLATNSFSLKCSLPSLYWEGNDTNNGGGDVNSPGNKLSMLNMNIDCNNNNNDNNTNLSTSSLILNQLPPQVAPPSIQQTAEILGCLSSSHPLPELNWYS